MINSGPCYRCKTDIYMPEALYNAAHRGNISFWCPYGHEQIFAKGKTEAELYKAEGDKLRQQLQRAEQRIAEKDDAIAAERDGKEAARRQAAAARGQVTKLKNRAARGVCPCCSRHFTNLERHMTTKHPDFTIEAAA